MFKYKNETKTISVQVQYLEINLSMLIEIRSTHDTKHVLKNKKKENKCKWT